MKYAKIENQITEVSGCTRCPFKVDIDEDGSKFMRCEMRIVVGADENGRPTVSKRNKKLVGKWMGAYHESCPLPSNSQGEIPQVIVNQPVK